MKCYIEIWKAKEAWKNLSVEERGNYLNQFEPAIQQLTEKGVQVISWGINDSPTINRADFDFFAVWQFPDEELMQNFEKLVESAGWYNYFHQENLAGDILSPEQVIWRMIELG